MNVNFTARHFKAHDGLKHYALSQVSTLKKYYDGIVNGSIVLRFEKAKDSTKIAEINLAVYGTNLVAIEKSEDFYKSIDNAVEKLERQLLKYKGKRRGI
ncbi:MAG TPA: ribosome-associated translation inhibitor RaiA [Bacteroidota bacterium]|jgi:putative sigma-54 modulation protein|nr:ribosome-associated translation inhibitor RaiA [Bacteroidota bacterium]